MSPGTIFAVMKTLCFGKNIEIFRNKMHVFFFFQTMCFLKKEWITIECNISRYFNRIIETIWPVQHYTTYDSREFTMWRWSYYYNDFPINSKVCQSDKVSSDIVVIFFYQVVLSQLKWRVVPILSHFKQSYYKIKTWGP